MLMGISSFDAFSTPPTPRILLPTPPPPLSQFCSRTLEFQASRSLHQRVVEQRADPHSCGFPEVKVTGSNLSPWALGWDCI